MISKFNGGAKVFQKTVECIEVSDQEDFGDLVDRRGVLRLDAECRDPAVNWFNPKFAIPVQFRPVKTTVNEKLGTVTVRTAAGNTFVFQVVKG